MDASPTSPEVSAAAINLVIPPELRALVDAGARRAAELWAASTGLD